MGVLGAYLTGKLLPEAANAFPQVDNLGKFDLTFLSSATMASVPVFLTRGAMNILPKYTAEKIASEGRELTKTFGYNTRNARLPL